MTLPEYLGALAIACFLIAFAAYIIEDILAITHQALTETGRDGSHPWGRTATAREPSTAGPYDWEAEDVA